MHKWALGFMLIGCGGTGASSPATPKNSAPTWLNAPTSAAPIGQGQTLDLAVTLNDAENDAITVTPNPPDGVDVDVATGHWRIHPDYTLQGAVDVPLTLTDARGASATVTVP